MRTSTVTQALLRAICGQLIEAKRAFAIERNLIRATTEQLGGLHAPPRPHHLAAFAPAQLYRFGLPSRKGTALVRISRTLDVERFRDLPGNAAERDSSASAASARGRSASCGRKASAATTGASSATSGSQALLGDPGSLGRRRRHRGATGAVRGSGPASRASTSWRAGAAAWCRSS